MGPMECWEENQWASKQRFEILPVHTAGGQSNETIEVI